MNKKLFKLVLLFVVLMDFRAASAQDANKYHGGSYDGHALGTSVEESFLPLDYGDLPSAYSLTLKADNGACHVSSTLYLGASVDVETDGQESPDAAGDDDNGDDEDGVIVNGNWQEGVCGGAIDVSITGGSGYLSGWIDWNNDNDFNDAGEYILDRTAVSTGAQTVTFILPSGVITATQTYHRFARFRLTPDNAVPLALTGKVSNGEVEDYYLQFNGLGYDVNKYHGGSYDGSALGTSASDLSLPVELFSFSAVPKGVGIALQWVTESEVANLGFILERSEDDHESWEAIASYRTHDALKGQGNTSNRTEYTFTDMFVEAGHGYYYRLSDVSIQGEITTYPPIFIQLEDLPQETLLEKIYPNPFNPQTCITYRLAEDTQVKITVFDMLGRSVKALHNGRQHAGSYHIYWNGTNENGMKAASGTYIIRMQTDNTIQIQKVMFMK